jgi:hypothetical protein
LEQEPAPQVESTWECIFKALKILKKREKTRKEKTHEGFVEATLQCTN